MTDTFCDNTTGTLSRTIALLNDLRAALEQNAYSAEAEVVKHHIQTLRSPKIESRMMIDGMNHIMEELAKGFCDKENGDVINSPI